MASAVAYEAIRTSAAAYRRGVRFVGVEGAQRGELLGFVLAKSTEYAQPGTVVESLALDASGQAIDLVLALFEEGRTVLASDVEHGLLDELTDIVAELGLIDVTVTELSGWTGVAIEGPKSWRAVQDLIDDDIAGLTLNQVRSARRPDGEGTGLLTRVGVTAEFGYYWVGEADAEATFQAFVDRVTELGGAATTKEAVRRAALEVNHPLFPEMFEGLTLREGGVEWMAGSGREDEYRGQPDEVGEVRTRGLVAVRATGQAVPPVGTEVLAGGVAVGTIYLVAAPLGQPDGFGLALLEAPFEVPGLELEAGGVALQTVSRPSIDPVSWAETIG